MPTDQRRGPKCYSLNASIPSGRRVASAGAVSLSLCLRISPTSHSESFAPQSHGDNYLSEENTQLKLMAPTP